VSGILFVGDVHGCAAELRLLLDQAGASEVVLLGDLFTKGPDPAGVWALVQQTGARGVLGNHDAWVLSRWRKGTLPFALPEAAITWLGTLPLHLQGPGWLAVHAGFDPERGVAATSRHDLLNLRRWPDDADPANPFWWELYEGPGLVVHGHDAVRGLVDRRPRTLGLDTGCVYGGALTGYLLEQDRLLTVPAARAYKPV